VTDHLVDAVKIEQDLMKIVPQDEWAMWSHLLIHHGRAICQARKPRCEVCPLLPHCPAGQKFIKAEAKKAGGRSAKSG
jgi:endonuclease-3